MTAIGIYGSLGRMGQAIVAEMAQMGVRHIGGIDATDDPNPLATEADVIVDFSTANALEAHLAAVCAAGTPIVIGTTGLRESDHAAIDAAAQEIPVLQSGTTSLGVTLLARLVREAASRLGGDHWDIEIIEAHHRQKIDAPSGTALLLGSAAAEGRGTTLVDAAVYDRSGLTGARSEGTIGFASVRGGTVIGDHSVIFAGEGERIELVHRAEDRVMFARGAISAALWLAKQPAGRYTMADVLGL